MVSLTNTKDIVANTISVIDNNNIIFVDDMFLPKTDSLQLTNHYTKAQQYTNAEVDDKLDLKAVSVDVNIAASALATGKADKAATYSKIEVTCKLDLKAYDSTSYTKAEVNDTFNFKADKSTPYTKT